MSFYTTLSFYRPTAPPQIIGADLAGFVSAFAALGAADGTSARLSYEIRFGRSVDQDDKPTDWDEPVLEGPSGGGIYINRTVDFDAEGTVSSFIDLAGALTTLGRRPIYRANLMLGQVVPSVYDGLSREPSEENEMGLSLDSWSMKVGPILSYNLATEEPYHVGWVAVQVSGHGYLYPWAFRNLIDRAEALTPIREMTKLCRRKWPVPDDRPPRRVVKSRKATGNLWPYPRADQPWDWFWGLQESG
jgi:hypothetical protein